MLINILNIYNPLNNIKFTKEKKKWKIIYPLFDFLKKKCTIQKEKEKDKSLQSPKSKY